jgi:hypothetical protein
MKFSFDRSIPSKKGGNWRRNYAALLPALLPVVLIPDQGIPVGVLGGWIGVAVSTVSAPAAATAGHQSDGQTGHPNDSP